MSDYLITSVSDSELCILGDIWELGYGELHSVRAELEEYDIKHTLTEKERNFIFGMRENGGFDVVAIHEGQPVSAQKAGLTRNDISCIKKFRF